MRTALITGILLVIMAGNCFASSVKVESKISDEVKTDIHLDFSKEVKEGLSVFVYSLTGRNDSEAYAGLRYAPVTWLTFSLGAGIETAEEEKKESPWRAGSFLYVGKEGWPFSLLAIYEDGGGTGPFYKGVATYSPTDWLTTGVWVKRFAGIGPMVQVAIPGTPAKIYAVPSYDFEFDNSSVIVGVSIEM